MEFDQAKQNKALQKAESMASDFNPEEAEQFAQKHQGANTKYLFK